MIRTCEDIPGVEWVGGTGDFIQVDGEKCTGCGNCLKVCLGECYAIQNRKAVIQSLDKCFECGACWYVCEQEAIRFSWPKGGTGFRTNWG